MDSIIFKNEKELLRSIDISRKLYILLDKNVYTIHGEKIFDRFLDFDIEYFIVESGEKYNTYETVLKFYFVFIFKKIKRSDYFISIGGGVTGDIGGFVSSTYMRGLKHIQCPTTLLAQVDSSIGGKTGFDYRGLKNIIGTFSKPYKVFIDSQYLKTLEKKEILSGIGEILKYGLIYDFSFFELVAKNIDKIYSVDDNFISNIVKKSIFIKNDFVSNDFKESGSRKFLNFGHTVGHSIESYYGFSKFTHGECIIMGMIYESYIGYKMELIDLDYFKEIASVLLGFVKLPKLQLSDLDKILSLMEMDKKINLIR